MGLSEQRHVRYTLRDTCLGLTVWRDVPRGWTFSEGLVTAGAALQQKPAQGSAFVSLAE